MQQLAGIGAKASSLAQAVLRALLVAAKNMTEDGRAVRCGSCRGSTAARAAEQSAQQTTQTTGTAQTTEHVRQTASALVLLQRAQQIHRALRLRRVIAQRAQKQRQRSANSAVRLRGVGAQVLGHLLQRRALQLGHQLFDKRLGSVHGAVFQRKKEGAEVSQ